MKPGHAMDGRLFPGTQKRADGPLVRLNKRADYLKAKQGKRAHGAPFLVQAHARGDALAPRIGITVTRKVGGAVVRNRIKRRLKSAISTGEGLGFRAGYDYVLIARGYAKDASFDALTNALRSALKKVHSSASAKRAPNKAG